MTDKIYLKDLTGMKAVIAKLCDFDHNGVIEKTDTFDEVSIFNSSVSRLALNWEPDVKLEKVDTKALKVRREVIKSMKLTGKSFTQDDIQYWTNLVKRNSELSGMPTSFIAAIIGRETKFSRNVNTSTGKGPMQVTGITTKDMYSNKNGGRYDLYEKLDSTLLHEIMYKKDDDGNFLRDSTGNMVKRFSSSKALQEACAKDDELGIQVGLLCFQMKYAEAVKKIKNTDLIQTIEDLKSGKINLTDTEQKAAVIKALKNYNSVFSKYAPAVIDSFIICDEEDALNKVKIKPRYIKDA